MRCFSFFVLLASGYTVIASPVVMPAFDPPITDPAHDPRILTASIQLCKNKHLFKQRFFADIRGVETVCDSNQIQTCVALSSLCAGTWGITYFLDGVPLIAAVTGYLGAYSSCHSGPAYCGNCFNLLRGYQGQCGDGGDVWDFLNNAAMNSVKQKKQKGDTYTNDVASGRDTTAEDISSSRDTTSNDISSGNDGLGSEVSQLANGLPEVDDTKWTAKKSVSDGTSKGLRLGKSTDGDFLAEGKPSEINHTGTDDILSDTEVQAGEKPEKGNAEDQSGSSNISNPDTKNTV